MHRWNGDASVRLDVETVMLHGKEVPGGGLEHRRPHNAFRCSGVWSTTPSFQDPRFLVLAFCCGNDQYCHKSHNMLTHLQWARLLLRNRSAPLHASRTTSPCKTLRPTRLFVGVTALGATAQTKSRPITTRAPPLPRTRQHVSRAT